LSTAPPRIVGVAFLSPEGTVYALGAPARHHHLIRWLCERGVRGTMDYEQGFIDDRGRFLRRVVAARVAEEAGQLLANATCRGRHLYSEDVW
jgi:hypothetical protein